MVFLFSYSKTLHYFRIRRSHPKQKKKGRTPTNPAERNASLHIGPPNT